jgi:hypothetical protein
MATSVNPKIELLNKTAEFYRRSLADYREFVKTENKPRTRKQLEKRLQTILNEIESLITLDAAV